MAGEGVEPSLIWATPGQRVGPTFLSSAQVQAGHPPIPWPSCGVCITGMCPLGREQISSLSEPHPTLHSQLGSWVCQAGTGGQGETAGQGERAGQSQQEPQSLTWPHAWPAGLGASAWP